MPTPRPLAERFWEKVALPVEPDGCMPWTACKKWQGYGHFGLTSKRTIPAHRLAYILTYGPVPAGMDVDHDCHNRSDFCPGGYDCLHRLCCNPSHLIARTRRDNLFASPCYSGNASHCPNGHDYATEGNMTRTPEGWRSCQECKRIGDRRRRAERKAAS